jgi:olefin beta-lactone synthetase
MNDSIDSRPDDVVNVSADLKRMARMLPHKRAVVCPVGRDRNGCVTYSHLTFRQFDRESDALAHGLDRIGIRRGVRTILMVRPSLDFFVLTFALFKVGAVPVMVDPGMGIGRMLGCLRESRPEAFIGIPAAHALRTLRPGFFRSVRIWVTVGRRWFWGGHTLDALRDREKGLYPAVPTTRDETAAVLFTTGSTGPAKGVVYTHGIFDAQVRHIKTQFGISVDEIDLPTFPLFALFDPALGMTAVIPDMDPTQPARVDPTRIIGAIEDHGVTNMFASPALLDRVGRYGEEHGIRLSSLKRVISAGAPTLPANVERFAALLVEAAEIHSGYGATEAMPVSSIGSNEILSETRFLSEKGFGTCVGRPISGMEVRILRITDDPIPSWRDGLEVPAGEIGEITVRGELVTRGYFNRPESDALAKIADPAGIWHRMGDVGWLDDTGRLWFCGRKNHRVVTSGGTLFTIPCESVFNRHPRVFRSALVGVGTAPDQKPVICIEPEKGDGAVDRAALTEELIDLARKNDLTRNIDTILFHEAFPVDIRHNSKIFREKLAVWAAGKLAGKG